MANALIFFFSWVYFFKIRNDRYFWVYKLVMIINAWNKNEEYGFFFYISITTQRRVLALNSLGILGFRESFAFLPAFFAAA